MAADKTADAIKLNLRLPKPLHKRLKRQARHNNVSLNTEIVNQLEGQPPAGVKRAMETLRPLFEETVRAALQRALYEAAGLDQEYPIKIRIGYEAAGLDQELPTKIRIEPTKPEQK